MPVKVETFTATFDDLTNNSAVLGFLWEDVYVGVPFSVDTDKAVMASIDEVMKGKPDAEVFLRAARELSLLPEECVGIEDAPAGISAIKSGMMKSIGVGEAVKNIECDLFVEDTSYITKELMLTTLSKKTN